jgi:hypothetical protein
MTKLAQDFVMWAGTSKRLVFDVTGATEVADILDATWTMGPVTKALPDGILLENDSGGGVVATIDLDPADTEALNDHYRLALPHQLVIEDTQGNRTPAAEGTATIHQTLAPTETGS